MNDNNEIVLEMKNVTKEFPSVKALDDVSLTVRAGTVHALMGENGAGKSTLMKCLFGIHRMDGGKILLNGKEVSFKSPKEALENGVAMVHQELSQALKRSVMDNLWLGRYPKAFGVFVNEGKMYSDTVSVYGELGLTTDPKAIMGEMPPSNHKYDIIDYYEIDEMFGGKEAFKRLVEACHERGIKIMLDAVFNHVSEKFYPFGQVMALGKQSEYFDWFVIDGDKINADRDNYDCFAACKYMPKLNTNNPEVQSYLIDVAKHYITEYGIDGWRLDVADEVSHDFWRQMRRKIKAVNPDAVLIGENWHNSESFLQGDQFDSIMNYGVTKAFLDFFAREIIDEKGFAEALNAQLMRYTDTTNNMMFNLLDCHDTHRFYSEVGCDARKLMRALLTLVFLPGSINLYYGTEILTEGGYDPDSRRTFDFEKLNNSEIKGIKGEIAYILKLKNQPAIAHGSIRIWSGDGYVTIERKCEEQTLTLKICSKNYTIEGEML